MHKKIFLLSLACIFQNVHAETCPTLAELKTDHFKQRGWQILNINSGEILSEKEWKKIKPHVEQFAMARWIPDAPEGAGQCFYKEKSQSFELEIYVVKNTFPPNALQGNWHTVSYNIMQCNSVLPNCSYKDYP